MGRVSDLLLKTILFIIATNYFAEKGENQRCQACSASQVQEDTAVETTTTQIVAAKGCQRE